MEGGGSIKVGYHYYMNVQFALAHAGCTLLAVKGGDRFAFEGEVSGEASVSIDKPSLFGGPDREGGWRGVIDFMPGEPTQGVNSDLANAVLAATGYEHIPAYRGITTAYFKGSTLSGYTGSSGGLENDPGLSSSFLWSSMNPYFKDVKFRLKRCWEGWNSAKATITVNGVDHANPAHIIYECLVNSDWGRGYPTVDIDDTSFSEAADQLHSEGFGLSLEWKNQTQIDEFISDICEHINASLVEDRVTGKWRLILVRDNYDPATLTVLDESNCKVSDFQRKSMSDTVNEVVVSYTRPDDGEEDTVTVQDVANFASQGQVNSQKREYPGIGDRDLAARAGLRDLKTLSKPLAKVTIEANREAFSLYPGQPFKLVWPRLGLDGVIFRIGSMNLGTLTDGKIEIEAVEDVFGLPSSVYSKPQPIGWVDTNRSPEPVETYRIFEPSYYELYTSTDSADRLDWPDDVGFGVVMSDAPNEDSTSLTLYDNDLTKVVGSGEFTPMLVLTQDLPQEAGPSTAHFDPSAHPDILMYWDGGGLAWIDDELVNLTAIDTVNGEVTVERGSVDTVPKAHTAGATVWFYRRGIAAFDPTMRVAGETVNYKLLSKTSEGTLDPSNAPTVNYTFQNRQLRPYAPGNVKIEGEYFPEVQNANFDPTITWSHRDRTQQLADPIDFTVGDIGPETGTTYHLRIYDENGNLAVDDATLTGTSFDWTTEADDLGKRVLAPSGVYDIAGVPDYTMYIPTDDASGWTDYSAGQITADTTYDHNGDGVSLKSDLDGDPSGGWYPLEYNLDIQNDGVELEAWTYREASWSSSANADRISLIQSNTGDGFGFCLSRGSSATIGIDLRSNFYANTVNNVGVGSITEGWYRHHIRAEPKDANDDTLLTYTLYDVNGNQLGQTTYKMSGNDGATNPYDRVHIMGGYPYWVDELTVTPFGSSYNGLEPLRRNSEINVKLKSQRDSLDSFQEHEITVKRDGWGYRWGEYYGGH